MFSAGMQIIENPLIPAERQKLKLHPDAPVSDKFRSEMDKWLLDMFGTERVVYVIAGKTISMNPENAVLIKGLRP